jgi:tRNA modification GTPase
VVRVSGPDALHIADLVFRGKPKPSTRPGHTISHGWIADPDSGRTVDEVLLSVFRRPRSYTGEDMVEVSGHGGPAVTDAVLSLLIRNGARPAAPGEFTRRAVLNGKLDLAQAEAVLDLVQARSTIARERAVRQLSGIFSNRIEEIEKDLRAVQTRLTGLIEFGEELPAGSALHDVDLRLKRISEQLAEVCDKAETGPILRQGALVAIVGAPNAGKSSLFNRLVGEDRAIVTDTPGTTRDAIEAGLDLKGLPVRLVDTAGWRAHAGRIEAIGAARARHYAQRADALLLVLDSSKPLSAIDEQIVAATEDKRRIMVFNKADLKPPAVDYPRPSPNGTRHVRISAKTGLGLSRLKDAVVRLFTSSNESEGDFIATRRQIEGLRRAQAAIETARASSILDVRMSETDNAMTALEELLGRLTSEQVLDAVFSQFCVGK